jgi:hypothetical protein
VVEEAYEEYRLRAAYCREMASSARTLEMRAEWDRLANTWLAMIPPEVEVDGDGFYEAMISREGVVHYQQRAA